MLKGKVQEDLKNSMLSKEELKTSVLRMLLSAITYHEIQKGGAGYEATDEDVQEAIAREIKKRRESIEMFRKGQREDLANKEEKEMEILKTYQPEQMSEEEVRKIVKETVQQVGAGSMSDMGKVMGALMPKVKGKAEGSLVSRIVREELPHPQN
ncbi:GatB/YqeY domain-containing protein [Candidatus Parcubacteria bacterium]|nr:MAG: GatB/YqeY domain-containing protein [Candidatus Parcubacteria bacterium]